MSRFPVVASFAAHEIHNLVDENSRLFLMRKMAGALNRFETRARNHRAISAAVSLTNHAIVCAPKEQRRNTNAMQPAFQPRIMEIGTPGKARGGFAGARGGKHLARGQGFVVAPAGVRSAIGDVQIFGLSEGENV